jgi:hypothetical protein
LRFAPIVPVSMLPRVQEYNYHLILAHLVRTNKKYEQFYTNHKGFKILDNGAAEGQLVDTFHLLEMADKLKVQEVVCPDVLGDCPQTIQLLRAFMPFASKYHVMVPLQAQNWTQFDRILGVALEHEASSVALPKILAKYLGPLARLHAAEHVRRVSKVPIHALGCTDNLREALWIAKQGIVRGLDTAAPVVHGLAKKGLRGSAVKRPENYFSITEFEPKPIEENLDEFRKWCAATPSSQVRGVQSE